MRLVPVLAIALSVGLPAVAAAPAAQVDHITLTPIGWAVSSRDGAQLRAKLTSAGLAVSEPSPGSRTTPAGKEQWRVAGPHLKSLEQLRSALDLRVDVAEAPSTSLRLSLSCPKGKVEFH